MRKYDKNVEKSIEEKYLTGVKDSGFVHPIGIDYPKCLTDQMMIFNFLNAYGLEKFYKFSDRQLIDNIPAKRTNYSVHENDTNKDWKCVIDVREIPITMHNGMKVIFCWDYGVIFTSHFLMIPTKPILFSRYRLYIYYSDGSRALTLDNITNDQLANILKNVEDELNDRVVKSNKQRQHELKLIME